MQVATDQLQAAVGREPWGTNSIGRSRLTTRRRLRTLKRIRGASSNSRDDVGTSALLIRWKAPLMHFAVISPITNFRSGLSRSLWKPRQKGGANMLMLTSIWTQRRLIAPVLALLTGLWANEAQAQARAYVTNSVSNTLSVIDTATSTVVATVLVGSTPFGVAVNRAGRRVLT